MRIKIEWLEGVEIKSVDVTDRLGGYMPQENDTIIYDGQELFYDSRSIDLDKRIITIDVTTP